MSSNAKQQKCVRYVIFGTKWGYFGLAGTESALWRSELPELDMEMVKGRLLKGLETVDRRGIEHDKKLFRILQEQVITYFEGQRVSFSPALPVLLDRFAPFTRAVLRACRRIEFGDTINYSELARTLGRPGAGRAVGNALATNPTPLIIPCHRVIRSDGLLGGFSAPGGLSLKRKLLAHEQNRL
jgi:methylated-DNA-[protein]-cysteine S-methyltransferase